METMRTPFDSDGEYEYCIKLMDKHGFTLIQDIEDCLQCPVYEQCEIQSDKRKREEEMENSKNTNSRIYCRSLLAVHGHSMESLISTDEDCTVCPVVEYCEVDNVIQRDGPMKTDETKGFSENLAFIHCMIPVAGPVTREEMIMVKRSLGKLWMAFWNLRQICAMTDIQWAEEIRKTMEKYGGGIEAYQRRQEIEEEKRPIKVTPCCNSRHWHIVNRKDIPSGVIRCELCDKMHDFENLIISQRSSITEDPPLEAWVEEKKAKISRKKVDRLLHSIRSFFGTLPFTSTYGIPQDCETILDLLDHFKMPLNYILQYILPALGYTYIEASDGSLESIEGEDEDD